MEIKVIDDREKWDAFVSSHPRSSILQSFGWGEVKAFQGWMPVRLGVLEGEEMIGAVSILKRKLPYTGKCIFYAPRGPVIDFKNEELFDFLLKEVRIEAKKHKAVLLKIDPVVYESDEEIISLLKKKGFKIQKKQIQPRSTFYIDLTQDLDKLLAGFEEKTRYNIRLSAKKGVAVKEEPEEGLDNFYKIYEETAKRDKFLIHPRSYYEKIQKELLECGMGNIFTAYFEGKPVASIFLFAFGEKVWYMYGASLSEHRNVMPNHALHFEAIKWAKDRGYKTYDLWGIPSNPRPDHPLWGVYRFKKGFKGKLVKYVGAMDLVYDPVLYVIFNQGVGIFKNIRSLITKGKISDSLSE